MLKLENLKPGLPLDGLEPSVVVTVAAVVPIGNEAVTVFYRTPDGTPKERLLGRADEASLSIATVERPWSFDGDGEAFQLTCEAKRFDLAFLFDPMMAVHTSNVEPLPHQITAVYESMLPRQPLRFVLADDPGAGKTIMAGLYIRELIMRADAKRVLIVAPGSLVEQWRDEMSEKFGLDFHVYTPSLDQASPSGNAFEDFNQLIVRLDQMARGEEETPQGRQPGPLQVKLLESGWDLVVFDEAHKLAAHYFGSKLEKTGRFRFAERIGGETRHLLLMTATPQNGKEEDFQLFLSLLDSDRFYGKFRDGVHKVDASDLMRRMVKEENDESIVTIHGGTHRDERRRIQAAFRSDPDIRVLVATDAAGEGVNLQCANLMVNYDLPWNPNRLEQRFGRIHRIGQTEVCHLWNLVAKETREGDVYHRLLQKLEVESESLKGRVFDILGEVFEDTSLKDLLMQAIRYGDMPEVRERLNRKIDTVLDHDHLKSLLNRNALAQETMSAERLYAVKEEMEKAEARRLQPFFVRSFFLKAFEQLEGSIYPRELGRFEITHVPTSIRERDRRITGRNRREQEPVLKRYERVCFEKEAMQPTEKAGLPRAVLMHPGHPLMLSITDILLEQNANLLRRGSLLLDPADEGTEPWLMFLLTHEVKSGDGLVLSKRMQFVRVDPDGKTSFAGWAPHLDLEPIPASERTLLADVLDAPWNQAEQEQRAVALAASTLVPDHFREVSERRINHVDKTLAAVHERLNKEIAFWSDRWIKLKEDLEAGRDVRLNVENARRTVTDLEGRLENRRRELQSMRHVVNGTPIVLGGALVIPAGLMGQRRGDEPVDPVAATFAATFAVDPAARSRIEKLAMDAVRKVEESTGCHVTDVSKEKCGWDLTSQPPSIDKKLPLPRHIEVKGRIKGASTVTITRNEMLYAFNQGDKFVLAIVLVNEDDSTEGPYYVYRPFDQEPGWGVSSINYDLSQLLLRAEQ